MHPFPNVEEVEPLRLRAFADRRGGGSEIFTPEAVDHIFRCSEGIPRNINNLCDNAMLAAYSAGERLNRPRRYRRGRRGASNMLPRADLTKIAEAAQDQLGVPGRVLQNPSRWTSCRMAACDTRR